MFPHRSILKENIFISWAIALSILYVIICSLSTAFLVALYPTPSRYAIIYVPRLSLSRNCWPIETKIRAKKMGLPLWEKLSRKPYWRNRRTMRTPRKNSKVRVHSPLTWKVLPAAPCLSLWEKLVTAIYVVSVAKPFFRYYQPPQVPSVILTLQEAGLSATTSRQRKTST